MVEFGEIGEFGEAVVVAQWLQPSMAVNLYEADSVRILENLTAATDIEQLKGLISGLMSVFVNDKCKQVNDNVKRVNEDVQEENNKVEIVSSNLVQLKNKVKSDINNVKADINNL